MAMKVLCYSNLLPQIISELVSLRLEIVFYLHDLWLSVEGRPISRLSSAERGRSLSEQSTEQFFSMADAYRPNSVKKFTSLQPRKDVKPRPKSSIPATQSRQVFILWSHISWYNTILFIFVLFIVLFKKYQIAVVYLFIYISSMKLLNM